MSDKAKKIRAAIAGVLYYLKSEEEQFVAPKVEPTYPVPWSLSGRQTIMQNRALVQRRFIGRR